MTAAILLTTLLLAVRPLLAAELSPPLSLDRAKAVIAMRGGVGTIFADGDNRYLISRIESRGLRNNVFSVEIEIVPLLKHGQ